ncbi:MAG TPA: sulfotransferase [Rhodopila sp.]|uniref:sulfotransferase family protein n=1 Tax=Rhodopila sp. TaxID=2480087 RepID=UPI002D0E825D|nr:sulfotransferase [Rhodopila sp.]HVY15378.1 sulfotransferase [Rhodopila sp.]
MTIIKKISRIFWFEMRLWKATLLLRTSRWPLIPLVGSVGYLMGPWNVVRTSLPYFGHMEALPVLAVGVLTARVLMPADALAANAGQLADDTTPSGALAWLLSLWLILHRRMMRIGVHTAAFCARTRQRVSRAIRDRNGGAFAFNAMGYRSWWRLRSIAARRPSGDAPLVVLGGSPRSGTTLLRTILGRHSLIVSGPEITVFLRRISSPADLAERLGWDAEEIEAWQRESRSQAEFIERFGQVMRERAGKPVWLEKTPRNVGRFRYIRRNFPHAKLVHIVRDGRDVVCSLRRTPFARLDHAPPDSVKAALRCALQWRTAVEAGIRLRGDRNYYELRYEDLVAAPEQTLRALLAFLELPWEDEILEPVAVESRDADEIAANSRVFDSSHGRWRRDLSANELPALGALIGPTLIKLGYATGGDWASPWASPRASPWASR